MSAIGRCRSAREAMTLVSHALRIVESSKVVQLHQQLQSSKCSEDEFVAVVFGHSIFIRSLLVMHRKTATYRAHIGFNPLRHKSARCSCSQFWRKGGRPNRRESHAREPARDVRTKASPHSPSLHTSIGNHVSGSELKPHLSCSLGPCETHVGR